jgi:hypothetical protein
VYGRPDFGLATLHCGATAHTAQSSAGVVFRFWTSDAVIAATSPDNPLSGPVVRRCRGVRAESENNRLRKEKDSGMTAKTRKNETLELHASPIQPRAENTSAKQAVNHSEIKRRAYEIYLERGGLPGRELEDWLQAEYELQNAALLTPDRDSLQQRYSSNSGDRN